MAHGTQTTRLWHPFAAMGKVDGHELVLVRGEGSTVWDVDGTEYIDATAGLWFANVGHGRAEIADAVAAQLRTLAAALDQLGDRAAAFIGEPMIGAGGVIPPPDGYWPEVEQICRERDVLIICDEVISGFGRLGEWFGCQRYGFTPDLMTCAKGISSGYVPLSAVIA